MCLHSDKDPDVLQTFLNVQKRKPTHIVCSSESTRIPDVHPRYYHPRLGKQKPLSAFETQKRIPNAVAQPRLKSAAREQGREE